jgi:spore germination protein GerM
MAFERQTTVKSSTFGSEFIAMRMAVEMVKGLRYKLRMMGVEIEGPCSTFCDNDSVMLNTTRPESVLKKKHNVICYHLVREAIASGVIRVAREDTKTNMADLLTKLLPGPALRECVSRVLW